MLNVPYYLSNMKTKNSIYIVKGKTKSALINLKTQEMRSTSNNQLSQLHEDINLEENLLDYIVPQIDAYYKEILDIRLTKESIATKDFSFLNQYIKNGIAYFNVRIFCPEDHEISSEVISLLITWIHDTIFCFGLVIFIPEYYNSEPFSTRFSNYQIIRRREVLKTDSVYKPMFHSSPTSILVSKSNNLYHYSRDTLNINGNMAQLTNHNKFNIPKSQIENCKECAFRLTCFDLREVQQTNGKYYYENTCQYELDL